MELFRGNTDFSRGSAGTARLCVCVYVHTLSMYRVLQELVYSLAAAPLYIHTNFLFNCEFPFPELSFSPVKPPSMIDS